MNLVLLSAQAQSSSTPVTVPLIVMPIIIFIIVLLFKNRKKNKQKRNQLKAEQQQQFDNAMKGFVVSKELNLKFQRFLVDDDNKKFAFISGKSVEIYNFTDLLNFELNENGNSVVKGKGVATAVGAATFGLAGAMIGASGKRKNEVTCTSLVVRIIINSLENPQIIIPFITSETKKNSLVYNTNLGTAKNFVAILTYIENQKDSLSKISY